VIEHASIEGRMFHRGSVAELVPEPVRAGIGGHLMTLVRKELIRPDRAILPGDDGFRFGHILIRDAAYDSIPKRLRAELHERFADWLESRLGVDASDEILGYHVERAHRYRVELALKDEHTKELALRAGRLLATRGDELTHGATPPRPVRCSGGPPSFSPMSTSGCRRCSRCSVYRSSMQALAVYERKGVVPSNERTRALLAEINVSQPGRNAV
jgi:hypothetical protein